MVAPPYIPCPPRGYGGVERVVATLVDALVHMGHDVTLFGHPDSRVKGTLVTPTVEQTDIFDFQKDALHASAIVDQLGDFDLVHNHSVALLLFRQWIDAPLLTTVHGTTHYDAVRPIYRRHRKANYVSISDRQRHSGLEGMNWLATVYNGIDTDVFRPARELHSDVESYLLHIGTLCQRKGTAEAVQVAIRSGRRLILAGRIDPINQSYFDHEVRPYVDGDRIQFIGEVGGDAKVDLYQHAEAVLLPINWEEPFGLVVAEASSCGSPVLISDLGSAREVVKEGVTGFVSSSLDEMVMNVERLGELDAERSRDWVKEQFDQRTMVAGYDAIYAKLLSDG